MGNNFCELYYVEQRYIVLNCISNLSINSWINTLQVGQILGKGKCCIKPFISGKLAQTKSLVGKSLMDYPVCLVNASKGFILRMANKCMLVPGL